MATYAYVTMTDGAYAAITAVMIRSLLNTGTKHPIIVLGLPGLEQSHKEMLYALSAQLSVRMLEDIHPQSRKTINKIQIWKLTEFSKVVFLDSDMLVLRNIDDLFDFPQLAAASEYYSDYAGGKTAQAQFNSGVLVVEPSLVVYERLYQSLKTIPAPNGNPWSEDGHGDQSLLWAHFLQRSGEEAWRKANAILMPERNNTWQKLPWYSNAVLGRRFHFKELWKDKEVRVIHFAWVPVRPWDGGHTRFDWLWLWTAWSIRHIIDVRPFIRNRLRFMCSIYFIQCLLSSLKKKLCNLFGYYYE